MQNERLLFVDLMRGIALIFMIEVHTVNALMHPGRHKDFWFSIVDFINGLVAPSFLFIAGFAFFLAVQPQLNAHRALRMPFWKMLARIALIWMLGYLLHLPSFSLRSWQQDTTLEQWQQFFSVDVLQCIACGLLLIFVLRLLCKHEGAFPAALLVFGAAAVLPAAWMYRIDMLSIFPFPLAAYLIPVGSTLFPFFPWFGFMAAGVLVAWFFFRFGERGAANRYMQGMLLIGIVSAAAGSLLLWFFKHRLGLILDERPHVLFFVARLGCVLILCALCFFFCRTPRTINPFLICAGQETLMVYCIHLQILYRPVWDGQSVVVLAAQRFSFFAALLIAMGLILLMVLAAWCWHGWKKAHGRVHAAGLGGAIIGGAVLFLLR